MKKLSFFLMAMLFSVMSFAKTATIAYSGSTTSMTGSNDAATLGLDASLWNVVSDKGSASNHIGLNKDGSIRLYANKTNGNGNILTVSITQGTIDSITLDIKQSATYNVKVAGNVVEATSGTTYAIGASSFSIQNVTTDASTQLQFNKITINYTAGGGEEPETPVEPGEPETPEKTATSLVWSAAEYTATIGADNKYPTLTTEPADLAGVTYASSNTAAATIAADGTITLVAAGTTTITASYAGNDIYVAATDATYTLTVEAATPDPEEPENPEDAQTYDFTKIEGFTKWGSSYSKHEVTYSDAVVTFASANQNSQTITDQPVTKGGDVSLVLTDGMNIATVKWVCTQWGTKPQTITLHYSKDGGNVYTSTEITSSDFTISSDNLPAGTNAVKITFNSSSNQVGIKSCTITKVEAAAITQVPAPLFSLPAGAYDGAQSVELTCTMADATIHYTTDGTNPTTSSPIYSTAIQVTENMTIKAYAVKEGLEDSPMVEATYEISAPADVILDFTDNSEWGFPTEKTVDATDYTNGGYTVTVVGSAGQGFMFSNNNLMIGKNGSYLVLPTFNKPIEKIVTVGVASGSSSVKFNVYIGENAVSTEVTSCKVDQTFLITKNSQVANVAHLIKVTSDHNVRFSQIKFYFGEGNGPATALENIAVEGKAVKAIINGQLIIIKNGVQYNAQGQVIK